MSKQQRLAKWQMAKELFMFGFQGDDGRPVIEPTISEVAKYLKSHEELPTLALPQLYNKSSSQKWYAERQGMLRDRHELAMEKLKSHTAQIYAAEVLNQLRITDGMQDLFQEQFDAGKVEITVRDMMQIMPYRERIIGKSAGVGEAKQRDSYNVFLQKIIVQANESIDPKDIITVNPKMLPDANVVEGEFTVETPPQEPQTENTNLPTEQEEGDIDGDRKQAGEVVGEAV